MKILAHRGIWSRSEEGNSLQSLRTALEHGYGIETDIRDYAGRLVVSHNVADGTAFDFEMVLALYRKMKCRQEIAINIKADGLQGLLGGLLNKYGIENYFVFDMSVPEQVAYCRQGYRVFSRMSEYERQPVLSESAQGIWMDEWERPWIDGDAIGRFRGQGMQVAVISPEIHGRDRSCLWDILRQFSDDSGVLLCTDKPLEAEVFFNGKD